MIKKTLIISFLFLTAALAFPLDSDARYKLSHVVFGDEFSGDFRGTDSVFYDEENKRLYVSDSLNNRFVSFDFKLEFLAQFPELNMPLTNDVKLPLSFVKNSNGNFIFVDGENAKLMIVVFKQSEEGLNVDVEKYKVKGLPKKRTNFIPGRITIDSKDNLYVVDKLNKDIIVINKNGKYVKSIKLKNKKFYGCKDIKIGPKDKIYCVDLMGRKAYVFDDKGNVSVTIKSDFKFPVSIDVDSRGRIYILDKHKGEILSYTTNGKLLETIGAYGFRNGEFYYPTYIYIDKSDRIFALDGVRVQMFELEKSLKK